MIFAVGAAFVASAANTWYVDAVNGNDDWNGKTDWANADAANGVGPKRTLSVFTALVSAGDTIYVAPGRYNEKTSPTATTYRFYTAVGRISLIATGSKEETIIEGAADPDVLLNREPYGCGPKAVVPIKMNGDNNLVKGFTIANGRQSAWANTAATYGGGATFGASNDRMVDCVITNCVANRGGGVNNLGHMLRCRFTGNFASEGSHALIMKTAVNCVFEYTTRYAIYNSNNAATIINCTCIANDNGTFRSNQDTINVYNSVFSAPAGGAPTNKNCMFYNCVFDYDPTLKSSGGEYIKGANEECWVVSPEEMVFNFDRTPPKGSIALDEAVQSYYNDNFPTVWDASEKDIDINGNVRKHGTAMDLGAAERVSDIVDDNAWYVDAVNGNDANTGKTPELAKKTLAAIVANRVAGDVIYAAPGTYDKGECLFNNQPYRIVLPSGVRLVGTAGAENTIIVGKASDNPVDGGHGVGPGAVACVYCGEKYDRFSSANISGVTLTGGYCLGKTAKEDSYGAGFRGYRRDAGIMADCIVSNCVAARAAVYNFGHVVRCRFYNNMSLENAGGAVMNSTSVYDSYFHNSINGDGGSMHDIYQIDTLKDGGGKVVNCTFDNEGKSGGPHAANELRVHVFNSILRCGSDPGGAWYHNCVNTCAPNPRAGINMSDMDDDTVITNSAAAQISVEKYRPVVGYNVAIGVGDAQMYITNLKQCVSRVVGKDLWGKTRDLGGSLDVGAVSSGGTLARALDSSTGLETSIAKDARWHDVESGAEYTLSRNFTSPKLLLGVTVGDQFIDFNAHEDDWVYTGTFPVSGLVDFVPQYATVNDWYVDAVNGSDDNDGLRPSAAHAFKTLAMASTNSLLEAGAKVYVAEGIYDEGVAAAIGAVDETPSRMYIPYNVEFIATGRREATVVVGESSKDTPSGIGAGAVRCCLTRGGCLRGFTLRGGNVNVGSAKNDYDQGGGIRCSSTVSYAYDCEIYGCNAVRGGGVAGPIRLVRCYVHDNTINTAGVTPTRSSAANDAFQCSAYNCVIKGDCYTGTEYVNCTLLGRCWGNGTTFYNCYVGMDGAGSEAVRAKFVNCVIATTLKEFTLKENCIENTPCTFAANFRPKRHRSAIVNAADLDIYNSHFPADLTQYKDIDFAGGERVLEDLLDIGAGEMVWTQKGLMLFLR